MQRPKPKPNASTARSLLVPCIIASLLCHALLLGWLSVTPVSRPAATAERSAQTPPHISPARTAQVLEQLHERQTAKLTDDVRALTEAHRELIQLESQKRNELRQTATNTPFSPETISAAQEQARQAQAAAQTLTREPDTNTVVALREAQNRAARHQAEALEALARAEPIFEPAYQAQAEANAAQLRAAQAQAEAEGQLAGAAALLAKSAPVREDLEEAKQMLRDFEAQLVKARSNAVTLSNALPQLRAQAVAAQTAYTNGQITATPSAQLNRLKQTARDAQKAADNAQKNLTRAQTDITKFQDRITEQTGRIAKFSAKANPLTADPVTLQREAAEKFRTAAALQASAAAAQHRAAETFTAVRRGERGTSSAPATIGQDAASVYQSAVATEAALAETYRRLRATELALQRQIPLGRALELTDAAQPSRPDLAPALSRAPGQPGDVIAQRDALLEAQAQLSAMRSLADSMLARARNLDGRAGSAQHQTLASLAEEDDNQRAKDLTGAMRSGNRGNSSGNNTSGSGRSGSGTGSSSGGGGGNDSDGITSGRSGGGAGSGFGGSSAGASSGPPPVTKDLVAAPGRIISAQTVPGRWMFVDSWYLLGPFDNAGRANLEKQFPPETVIDLNATYLGKRGRPVRWDFHQSAQPRVAPPFDAFNPLASGLGDGGAGAFKSRDLEYIIYYGYTELRAEQECDVWLAIGSDDFSKLWIEDQLVWSSGKQHKSWRVDEGFRKVRLKQGVNRVLIRVENGHSQSEFSLAVCVP